MKKVQCYKCGHILEPSQKVYASGKEYNHVKRDSDGLDIFCCARFFCNTEFKIDMSHYIENKETEGFVAKTVSAKLDFSDGYDQPPKRKTNFLGF